MTTTKSAVQDAKTTDKIAHEMRMIPLSDLYLHPLNPRKQVSEEEIAALALSIESIGLMQNLLGLENADEKGIPIGIVGGGRRLRALLHLAHSRGNDPATLTVPVMLAKDAVEAGAWAGAENTARMALHPADEVSAYAAMIDHGATVRQVAKAFAVSERHVAGRLKLASLAVPVLAALKENTITLEQAAALAISDDHEQQVETLAALSRWDRSPSEIRASLTRDATKAGTGLTRFVTREEFEAAGGTVREDLFGTDVYFEDGDILARLAEDKLKAIAAEVRAEHWAWVDVIPAPLDYTTFSEFIRTHPEQADISEAEEAAYNALADAIEGGAASDMEVTRFNALEAKLAEERYSDAQRDVSGVCIGFSYDYSVRIERGLIRKGNRAAAVKAGVIAGKEMTTSGEVALYSASLADDLGAIRTGAVQQALLDHPELALDLLSFALIAKADYVFPLDIRLKEGKAHPKQAEGYTPDPRLQSEEDTSRCFDTKVLARQFAAFRKKPQAERSAMLTAAVAKGLSGGLVTGQANPVFEQIATLTGASVRTVWTPSGPAFFNRMTSQRLDTLYCTLTGKDGAESFAQKKKSEKVEYLHTLFNNPDLLAQQNKATQVRVAEWVPEGMQIAKAKVATARKKPRPKKTAKQGTTPTPQSEPCAVASTAA